MDRGSDMTEATWHTSRHAILSSHDNYCPPLPGLLSELPTWLLHIHSRTLIMHSPQQGKQPVKMHIWPCHTPMQRLAMPFRCSQVQFPIHLCSYRLLLSLLLHNPGALASVSSLELYWAWCSSCPPSWSGLSLPLYPLLPLTTGQHAFTWKHTHTHTPAGG